MSFLATNQESQPGFYTPTVPSFNGTPSSLCIGLHLRISHQCDDLDIICLLCGHKFHGFHPSESSTIEQTRPKQIRETIAKNERPRRNFRAMHLASTKPLSNKALCHQSLGMVNAGFFGGALAGHNLRYKYSRLYSAETVFQISWIWSNFDKVIKPHFSETFPATFCNWITHKHTYKNNLAKISLHAPVTSVLIHVGVSLSYEAQPAVSQVTAVVLSLDLSQVADPVF